MGEGFGVRFAQITKRFSILSSVNSVPPPTGCRVDIYCKHIYSARMNHQTFLDALDSVVPEYPFRLSPPGAKINTSVPEDVEEYVQAKVAAAKFAINHGLEVCISDEQKRKARDAFTGESSIRAAVASSPEVILHIGVLLDAYDCAIVKNACQIRNYVTNRLILESVDENPSIRLRALENLGKISDVGLFSEKSDMTISHKSAGDLENRLRSRLEKIIGSGSIANEGVKKVSKSSNTAGAS